ncbi:MAG: carboxypeptidase-like regulatory domain-containing protein [Acidobacteriota bacterium]
MRRSNNPMLRTEFISAGVFFCIVLAVAQGFGAEYGRVSGKVTDTEGHPLMGATVLLTGPGVDASQGLLEGSISRVFTDAEGRFTIGSVTPGWYTLQVISPARLPVFRNGVQVQPGKTTQETFALDDIFSGLHWQHTARDFRVWGRQWKWILRTSASTRPILRYQSASGSREHAAKRRPLPARRLVALVPGTGDSDGLSRDPGTATVFAYLHPLDMNSDVLVAGSVSQGDFGGQSVIADYRRGLLKKNDEEITLAVHQLNLDGNGFPVSSSTEHGSAVSRGMVLRYTQVRQLSDALTLTAGFEMRYLDSVHETGTAQPEVSLAYRLNPSTVLNLSYGAASPEQPGTLLHRVGELNAFPNVTLRNFRPRLTEAKHAEIRLDRSLGAKSSIEIAAYHDGFQDVAVWGMGSSQELADWASTGNALVSSAGNRAMLNAGNYGSSGGHVTYARALGRHTEVGIMYAVGSALAARPSAGAGGGVVSDAQDLSDLLRGEFTQSVSGRFSTVLPRLRTRVVTTYSWLPAGRITIVDPYGQTRMDFQPFWGLQVRQPLPKIDMLPIQVVAIADFRNLLGQGSVGLPELNGRSVTLTPAYRTIRGGFAVQF